MIYNLLQIFMLSCIIFFSCATKSKTYKIVEVTLIEDRDVREHMFDRTLVEGKALWCHSHEQYELVEVKRIQNQANLIKARAND
ncbi:MAG: hypothetical protein VW963_08315 [Candidatus Neomarinimicrobiota bacterium]